MLSALPGDGAPIVGLFLETGDGTMCVFGEGAARLAGE